MEAGFDKDTTIKMINCCCFEAGRSLTIDLTVWTHDGKAEFVKLGAASFIKAITRLE